MLEVVRLVAATAASATAVHVETAADTAGPSTNNKSRPFTDISNGRDREFLPICFTLTNTNYSCTC